MKSLDCKYKYFAPNAVKFAFSKTLLYLSMNLLTSKGQAMAKKTAKQTREETIYLPDQNAKISELAYYKAEQRGFEPGHELDDWFKAEQELSEI